MTKRSGYVVYEAPTTLNTRTITKKEWASVGVEDQEDLFWGAANNWKVPASDISDAAWPHIEADPGLRHEEDAEKEGSTDGGAEVSEQKTRRAGKSQQQSRNG